MNLTELLASYPPARNIQGGRAEIRRRLEESKCRLVVVDDDPTGTQTVHGIRVYMQWSVDELRGALDSGDPVFYVSTNSRGLSPTEAKKISLELGSNLREAAGGDKRRMILSSRSDSTLRGHFPYEVEALATGLGNSLDGIIIAPALFEAGRYTIGDIHYVEQAGEMVPASETEFARDPVFGFKNSDLKLWVEEKTSGAVKAANVLSISLEMIRNGGPEAVAELLANAVNAVPIVVNAACYDDLEVVATGIAESEAQGKYYAYRSAACFVKVRGGLTDRPFLTSDEMGAGDATGLIVVGSYVGKTSRQLEKLLVSGSVEGIEMRVDRIVDERAASDELARVAHLTNESLSSRRSVVVYTSRDILPVEEKEFLETGKRIMCGLCDVVQRIETRPGFFIAKGGITSIELARSGLGVSQAYVLGQIISGVPVWRLGREARWPGMPYVVFPGNVGDDDALRVTASILSGTH